MSGPPDKYVFVVISGDVAKDLANINAQADLGFRFVANIRYGDGDVVLMGNYGQSGNS